MLKTQSIFHQKKEVTQDEYISRVRILEKYPVKTIEDFSEEEIKELESMYKPSPAVIHGFDTVMKEGPYENHTIEEILHRNPEWLFWAIHNIRGFCVQDAVVGAVRKRLEIIDGTTKK